MFDLAGEYELVSRDADGRVLGSLTFPNGPTVDGVNYLANCGFRGGARIAAWYVGLINETGFVALDEFDSHSSHGGWSEFTNIAGGLRQPWSPAAAVDGLLDSPNVAFSITASGTVRGAFLASQQATGTSSGPTLYCTAVADAGVAVVNGGALTFSYKLRITKGTGE